MSKYCSRTAAALRATAFCQNRLTYQKNPLVSLADRADQFWKVRLSIGYKLRFSIFYRVQNVHLDAICMSGRLGLETWYVPFHSAPYIGAGLTSTVQK